MHVNVSQLRLAVITVRVSDVSQSDKSFVTSHSVATFQKKSNQNSWKANWRNCGIISFSISLCSLRFGSVRWVFCFTFTFSTAIWYGFYGRTVRESKKSKRSEEKCIKWFSTVETSASNGIKLNHSWPLSSSRLQALDSVWMRINENENSRSFHVIINVNWSRNSKLFEAIDWKRKEGGDTVD